MLIISYGIPKSGSTLAYELVRGMLLNTGHSQDLENKDRRGVQPLERRMKRNFSGLMGRAEIEALLEQIGPDGRIAVKTHAWFEEESYSWIDALCEKGEVMVIASYRDPRDICLSLVDAAGRAREAGTPAFANVRDLEHAAKRVKHRVNDFRIWASFRNAVRLDYEDVAFDTTKAIDKIERALGIVCNREEVLRYAFEDAMTLKNKAKSHRHKEEMGEAQRQVLDELFRGVLRNAVDRDDQAWFDKMRAKMLKRGEA